MTDEPPNAPAPQPLPGPARLIDLQAGLREGWPRAVLGPLVGLAERALSVPGLNAVYDDIRAHPSDDNFFARALRSFRIGYEVSDADLARIPRTGAVFAVSNHPYGGLDGIVLGALLCSVRGDARVMGNYLLARMAEIRPWLLSVDPFGRAGSARANLRGMRETIKFLREGGCVGAFPSGAVSHWQWRARQVTDPPWSAHVARLVRAAEAAVVPVFFEGGNSLPFQLLGMTHPLLRTVLLPRELVRMGGRRLRVRVGHPIPFRRLAEFPTDEALTEFLRLHTYLLRERAGEGEPRRLLFPRRLDLPPPAPPRRVLAPLPPALPPEELERDIGVLPPGQMLVEGGGGAVYFAEAGQIPRVLEEIGRLRELTFREVNEGTGQPRDLDRFDAHYRHLFFWDREARALVGAYRFALTDEVLAAHGPAGLYTSTLFRYKPGFLETLGPALEMGRSFIVSAYQRKQASLTQLWRGIGRFVVRHPRHKTLFGPVSINPDYQNVSKDLMVQFLRRHRFDADLSSLVRAKRPPGGRKLRGAELRALLASVRDIEDVSALVSGLEDDRKGVPVLLRHYLRMNGRLVSFNVDPAFGQCLDGLIIVDLTTSDPKLLRIYLGHEGAESFLEYHRARTAAPAAAPA